MSEELLASTHCPYCSGYTDSSGLQEVDDYKDLCRSLSRLANATLKEMEE